MKVLLISVGTRGDIEPFLAIAEILSKQGINISCCFPEQFRQITEDSGFKFIGLTPQYLQMLESKEGLIAMGGKGNLLQKIKAYYKLYKRAGIVNQIMSKEQKKLISEIQPDRIVYHIKANYPLVYETMNPEKTILVSPIPYMVHPVNEHAHIGFKSMGRFMNKLTYKIANYGLLKNVQKATQGLYDKKKINAKRILSALKVGKTIYTISPSLFKQSGSWSENVKVLGYHERNKMLNWLPNDALLHFLNKNKSIVFITFGSMVSAEPKKKTELMLKVLERLGIPAIINTGSGGLVTLENYNADRFHFVSNIPYDWLLPKVDFMIHHGGSGTTHMAMKYNCPSLIIPHIIDQFLWNEINHKKGLGPKGISINRLNKTVFEALVTDLISNRKYKENARNISKAIKNENYSNDILKFIID